MTAAAACTHRPSLIALHFALPPLTPSLASLLKELGPLQQMMQGCAISGFVGWVALIAFWCQKHTLRVIPSPLYIAYAFAMYIDIHLHIHCQICYTDMQTYISANENTGAQT